MKKAIIIIFVIIICGVLACIVYTRLIKKINPLACETVQDCIDKKITCRANEQPYCQSGNLATGKEYPEPICVCLNPNLDY